VLLPARLKAQLAACKHTTTTLSLLAALVFGGSRDLSNDASRLALVARLFPDRADELARLATSCETFRSLCEDYELAVNTLRQLEAQNRSQDAERTIEYRRLIAELEHELSDTLNAGTK